MLFVVYKNNCSDLKSSTYISSVHYYLPEVVEENLSLQNEFPERVESNLIETLGVKSRHLAPHGMKASDMAVKAGQKFFEETGFDKTKIDALVYTSLNQDYITPATSCLIQHQLGLNTSVATFDIQHGCSGYVYGLALCKSIMHTMNMDNVLFITSTIPTVYTHPKNLSIRLLFGDAAAATLVKRADNPEHGDIGEFVFGTDGSGYQKIIIRAGWDANPLDDLALEEKKDQFGNIYTDSSIYMDGQGILLFMLKRVPKLIDETLQKNNLTRDDIDLYVLHQANYFALETIRKKMSIAPERFFYSMENTGNTIQTTIPIALRDAMDAGKIGRGSKVLIAGFGTGLSWAATVITF